MKVQIISKFHYYFPSHISDFLLIRHFLITYAILQS